MHHFQQCTGGICFEIQNRTRHWVLTFTTFQPAMTESLIFEGVDRFLRQRLRLVQTQTVWWWYLARVHSTGERSSTKSRAEILDTPLQGSRNRREECAARVQLWGETSSTFTGSGEKKGAGCRFTRQLAGQKWNWTTVCSKQIFRDVLFIKMSLKLKTRH